MHDKLKGENIELDNTRETLGDESSVMLDHSIFSFFERCSQINEILSEHNYFLRFYEQRNKFR